MTPLLGIVEWFEPGERERVERVVSELQELGVSHLRTAVSWADWFTEDGERWYDWLLPRLARDFELLPCVSWTPPSLAEVPKASAPPRRLRDYADFLDTLIERHGRCFEYVELWNEPNNVADWDWRLDLEWTKFAEMIRAAAYWAKRRGKRPVLGGMSPLDKNWLDLMARKGALEFVDVVGIHGFPGTWEVGWEGWPSARRLVDEVLEWHGLEAEAWITEAGYSTWRHDDYGQVRELVAALDAPVERLYWYCAEDLQPHRLVPSGIQTDIRHYHIGVHRLDGQPKLLARLWAEGGPRLVRDVDRIARRPRRRGPVTLITGGAGFVGTNVADRLVSDGHRVRIYDNLSRPGVEWNLRWLVDTHGDAVDVVVGDVRDRVALREAVADASQVFHFAAQVAVTTSVVDPVLDFGSNVQGTVFLLEELRRLTDPPPLLFTSTNKVYGALPDLELVRDGDRWEPLDSLVRAAGLSERRPLDFCTPYGCSKGAADQYVLDYAKTNDLPAIVFRMSCIYGPHQHGNEDQGWVAHFLLRALAGEPLTIYGDGAQVRDILFADDLVDAMLLALGDVERLAGLPFNMGGGAENAISLLELVDLIAEVSGEHPEVSFAPVRVGDQRYYVSDTSRFAGATGWRPQVGVRDGVEFLYRWLAEEGLRRRRPVPAAAR